MSSLPLPDLPFQGALAFDAQQQAKLPPIAAKRPPKQAPNVLLILLDDVGFGASSAFGGPVTMPTAERLAEGGPEVHPVPHHGPLLADAGRAAVRPQPPPGRRWGTITETATPSPGIPLDRARTRATPLAEILRQNGYNTAQFGKCHEVPVWESGPTGPFDHWPAFSGFERFYGFIGGETNQWTPALVDGSARSSRRRPGYHLMPDLADKAIAYIRQQKTPDPGQAVLHLLRAGRHAHPAPRPEGVDRASTRASSTRAGTPCARRRSRGRRSSA